MENIKELTLTEYLNHAFQELPEKYQNFNIKNKLRIQANEIIMKVISDNMSLNDVEELNKLREINMPTENIIESYLHEHHELFPEIQKELDLFFTTVINFK